MRKLLIAAMCAGLILNASVNAQILKDGNSVSVSYSELANKPSDVLMYIFKPGVDLSDGTVDFEDMQKLLRMEQRDSAVDIQYDFTLESNAPEGVYYVVIGGFDRQKALSERCEYFVHLYENNENKIVSELNNASDSAALKNVYEKYDGFAWVLDKENSEYKKDIDGFYKIMFDNFRNTFAKAEDAEEVFIKTYTLAKFNTLKGDELAKAIEILKLTDNSFYNANVDAVVKLYEQYTDKGAKADELKKTLAEAIAVTQVNQSDSEDVFNVIRGYSDIFDVNFDGEFKNVSEAQMAKALYHKDFVRAREVKEAFNSRLNALTEQSGTQAGSSGGKRGQSPALVQDGQIGADFVGQLSDKEIFSDINECEWAADYIKGIYRRQIMVGYDGYFRPNDLLTREELVKIIILAKENEIDSAAENPFDDVNEDSWFYPYVMTAIKNKFVFGVSENCFGAGKAVSRQEAAAMIYRVFANGDKDESGEPLEFTDSADIAEYSSEAVKWLQKRNIISGFPDNTFRPDDGLSRAQAAKIIFELVK